MNTKELSHWHVVIMAGGVGSRLWPLSTPEHPKQFIDLLGTEKSLLQMTVERFLPLCDISRFWVVTSEKYADIVSEQLPNINKSHILREPQARNTAPCIAYASWKIKEEDPDANIIVTPSDALVTDVAKFVEILSRALQFTEQEDAIVTVGITPDRPETGYGYIKSNTNETEEISKVSAFKEKPDANTAKEYLSAGNYFWNAGIFVWRVQTIVSQIRKYIPDIAVIMDRIAEFFGSDNETMVLKEYFPQCESISIDYAVMEKSKEIYVISGDVGWSDLGSWSSVHDNLPKDADGNAIVGNAVVCGCKNCLVHVGNVEQTIVLNGLESCIAVEQGGCVLFSSMQHEQEIKNAVNTVLLK